MRRRCLLALALCLVTTVVRAQAQAGTSEYEIKAAFLYNFAKFVQWPAATLPPQAPLIVCVLGRDPFGSALATIDHKISQGHELQVHRNVRLDEARSCYVLFVAESERGSVPEILHELSGTSVLTVSDIDRFAEAGGVIGLYDVDNRVQFSINLDAAHDASLQINSQLLKLARIVRREARGDLP